MSVTSGIGSTGSGVSTNAATTTNPNSTMNASDFINLMVTQLENQDPTQPASSSDLLAQMSQISQLQSSTTLTSSLNTMTQQNQVASAAGMMGKHVKGQDGNGNAIEGNVTSVSVSTAGISLELDSNQSLTLDQVTSISPQTTSASAATTPTTTN